MQRSEIRPKTRPHSLAILSEHQAVKAFWAWQSDLDQSVCRNFIKSALGEALKQLAIDLDLEERPELDHDTKDQSGMPDIVESILQKIAASSAFICDLTTVARTKRKKAVANPNVLIELGYAKRALGAEKIVAIANAYWYKGPSDLPFDLRNRRGPITYLLPPEADATTRQQTKAELVKALKAALRPILESAKLSKDDPHSLVPGFDDAWLSSERGLAQAGMQKTDLIAHMELHLHPHITLQKSSIELLDAMRRSQIHTFGWPIGIVLDSIEHRPSAHADGIRAEITWIRDGNFGDTYDYWALRHNGDFFLLQSLFEDTRAENAIFFNTRIVRVAEALLFADALYTALGAPLGATFSARVIHRNFTGRTLSGIGNRSVVPATARANESASEVTLEVGNVSDGLVNAVKTLLAPMFMLFDFKEFSDAIYSDIVKRFENGETS